MSTSIGNQNHCCKIEDRGPMAGQTRIAGFKEFFMQNFGLLVYEPQNGAVNIGDYIQSLAAKQFLPGVDSWLNREKLNHIGKAERTRIILNGWFMHNPASWPPAPPVDPLTISFHINSSAASTMTSDESVKYLKEHAPIGCRDTSTLALLLKHDVDAYFSACLTLTLKREDFCKSDRPRNSVLVVDPVPGLAGWRQLLRTPFEIARGLKHSRFDQPGRLRMILKALLSPDLLNQARWLAHEVPARWTSHEKRFALARKRLELYANARLVVTSRIHCALPCLAFGTPVIFLNSSASDEVSNCRFGGLLEMLNVVNINPVNLEVATQFDVTLPVRRSTIPSNPSRHHEHAVRLERICRNFIASGKREL